MKIGVFVVDIDYNKEISSITLPSIEKYAKSIDAEFVRITERKFPKYFVSYEKMQIHELGKDNDWNILLDCDMLIKEGMYNVIDLVPDGSVGAWQSYWEENLYNNRGPNIAIAGNFVVAPKICLDVFKPLDSEEQPELYLKSMKYVDEYCLSLNKWKYRYSLVGLELPGTYNKLFYHYNYTTGKK